MQFKPKTEKQIQEDRLIPDGWYDATVIKADEKPSKKGNDMIEVTLRVFLNDGRTAQIRDYLLEAMLEKMLHFCAAADLSEHYESGELKPEDIVGADVRCEIGAQEDKTGKYPPRNQVTDYQPRGSAATGSPVSASQQIDPADIPF